MGITPPIKTDDILIDWRTVGLFSTNSFLIVCQKTKAAALVDAAGDAEVLLEMIEAHDVTIQYLLQTHAHLDHVAALDQLKKATNAPILLHRDELQLYENVEMQCSLFGLPPVPSPPPPDRFVVEGEQFKIGELEVKVYETPGHTPGGISFSISRYLFSGDSLFAGSIGRTDLPGGDTNTLMASLQRFLTFSNDTMVFSGHGPVTTIGQERKFNPFLR